MLETAQKVDAGQRVRAFDLEFVQPTEDEKGQRGKRRNEKTDRQHAGPASKTFQGQCFQCKAFGH